MSLLEETGDAVAPATFVDWREQVRSVEQMAAWELWDATWTNGTRRLAAVRVTQGFFELFGNKS